MHIRIIISLPDYSFSLATLTIPQELCVVVKLPFFATDCRFLAILTSLINMAGTLLPGSLVAIP